MGRLPLACATSLLTLCLAPPVQASGPVRVPAIVVEPDGSLTTESQRVWVACGEGGMVTETTTQPDGRFVVTAESGEKCRFSLDGSTWSAWTVMHDASPPMLVPNDAGAPTIREVPPPPPPEETSATSIDMEAAKSLPVGSSTSRDFTAVVDMAPTASRDAAGISLAGTTAAESRYGSAGYDNSIQAGVLTAGMLDDLAHPGDLRRFARNEMRHHAYASALGGPHTVIRVVDPRGRPVPHARVTVSGTRKGFRLVTRADGRVVYAPKWDAPLRQRKGRKHVTVTVGGVRTDAELDLSSGDEQTIIVAPRRSKNRADARVAVDVALVVDVTGSMSDELEWLKVELREVLSEALGDVDLRLALVVYRDEGDEFVVRHQDFTSDHAKFDRALGAQHAGGGGDYPEAMHTALHRAAQLQWRSQDTLRLTLLVGDAPPHADKFGQTMAAADRLRRLGVGIYPVGASGVAEESELAMRAMAAMTAARYVFLTDDSGVGLPHAEPHSSCYDVRRLNDVLIDVLASEISGEPPPKGRHALRTRGCGGDVPQTEYRRQPLQRSLFDDDRENRFFGRPHTVNRLPG